MFRRAIVAAGLVVLPSIASAQQPCTTDARHVINELYRHMLERAADPGSQQWVDKLTSGSTVREIVHVIADSQEHTQRFYNVNEGAAANERAVANLYRHILGRQPAPAPLRTYTQMAAARGIHDVAHAILNSDEYVRTFGDWGVPGSGGVVYCGNRTGSTSSASANARMAYAELDRNNDGVIARTEWRGNASSFRMRDWNGDGVLSGDEVRPDAAPPADAQYRDYRMPATDRFSYLDVNNNGAIERGEWDGSLNAFYRLDRNNDGRLSRAEMGSARNLATFASLDANGDRRISLGEWPYSHRTFDQQDTNGDGLLTPEEFNVNALPATRR